MPIGYCQYPYPMQYQTYGFLSNYNPFSPNYYYPDFRLPSDFNMLPDTPFNRRQYPGIFESRQKQMIELKKAKKMFPELYNIPPEFAPNKF